MRGNFLKILAALVADVGLEESLPSELFSGTQFKSHQSSPITLSRRNGN